MIGSPAGRARAHRARRTRRAAAFALTAGTLLVLACTHGGDDATLAEVGGSWEGSWATTGPAPSGELILELEQTGATVTGTVTFGGHPCFGEGTVACWMHGMHFSGRFECGDAVLTVDADCPGQHATRFAGTFRFGPGSSCAGEQGTFQLERVATNTQGGNVLLPAGALYLLDPRVDEPTRIPLWRLPEGQEKDARRPSGP